MTTPSDSKSWFQTYSGKKIDPRNMTVADIWVPDIAHALAHIGRFNGHAKCFYSVAQHSIHVSRLVPPKFALAALMHDASEAYIGDIITPIKQLGIFDAYRYLERDIMRLVETACGLSAGACDIPEVKHADHRALCTEARDLINDAAPGYWTEATVDPSPIIPLTPHDAKIQFLNRFEELMVRELQTSFF